MMISEWLEMTKGTTCSPEAFELVNFVYQWHPSIPDSQPEARKKVLSLWNTFGFGIFEDMQEAAEKMKLALDTVNMARSRADNLTHDYEAELMRLKESHMANIREAHRIEVDALELVNTMKARYKK